MIHSLQSVATAMRHRVAYLMVAIRHWLTETRLDMLAVWRAAKSSGTYGSELRLHELTMAIGLWAMLPFQSLSPFQFFGHILPEQVWAVGMFGVALFGMAQMMATKGNPYANEDGRARALQMTCAAFVFLSFIFWVSSYPKIGTVVYPFVALSAWSLFMQLIRNGPR